MVGDETLEGYTPTDSTTVDLTSNAPTENFGAEGKKMMCADCGSKKVMYAEGETATYSPSNEPDMVSSSDFETPTNENFSAEEFSPKNYPPKNFRRKVLHRKILPWKVG